MFDLLGLPDSFLCCLSSPIPTLNFTATNEAYTLLLLSLHAAATETRVPRVCAPPTREDTAPGPGFAAHIYVDLNLGGRCSPGQAFSHTEHGCHHDLPIPPHLTLIAFQHLLMLSRWGLGLQATGPSEGLRFYCPGK